VCGMQHTIICMDSTEILSLVTVCNLVYPNPWSKMCSLSAWGYKIQLRLEIKLLIIQNVSNSHISCYETLFYINGLINYHISQFGLLQPHEFCMYTTWKSECVVWTTSHLYDRTFVFTKESIGENIYIDILELFSHKKMTMNMAM